MTDGQTGKITHTHTHTHMQKHRHRHIDLINAQITIYNGCINKIPHMHRFIVAVCKCRLWTEYFDMIWLIQVYIVEIDLTTVLLQIRILLIKRRKVEKTWNTFTPTALKNFSKCIVPNNIQFTIIWWIKRPNLTTIYSNDGIQYELTRWTVDISVRLRPSTDKMLLRLP